HGGAPCRSSMYPSAASIPYARTITPRETARSSASTRVEGSGLPIASVPSRIASRSCSSIWRPSVAGRARSTERSTSRACTRLAIHSVDDAAPRRFGPVHPVRPGPPPGGLDTSRATGSKFEHRYPSHLCEAPVGARSTGGDGMNKRFWICAGAAAAVLLLAASATATTKVAGTAAVADGTPAAAPFAQAWAQVPRTTAGRRAANVVVFGAEQDIDGFNTFLSCCNEYWAAQMGENETTRGAFLLNNKAQWTLDLASAASANSKGVTYTIRPNAYWYWGGKKLPVTYKDFVYTLQKIDDPNTDSSGRTGYSNLDPTRFTHKGDKQVTFFWRTKNCSSDYPCGPFSNWQYIFSTVFPSAALQGVDFNKTWTNCVCGSDGQPVSDGPYYVSNYTKGQGTVLKANP